MRVQLTETNYLHMAEVEVWVVPQTSGSATTPVSATATARVENDDEGLRIDDPLLQCASLSSEICFALAFGARLDGVEALTIKGDGGGGGTRGLAAALSSGGISTSSTDPRRYSFYSPEMSLLAETEYTTSATPPVQYEYIWFAGVPVAQVSNSVPSEPLAAPEVVWTVTDHLGTPKLQTDTSGTIVWHAEHEPYGQIYVLRTGEGRHQPLRFPGQEAEQLGTNAANGVSERSYNMARWYRAAAARYTQADPLGIVAGPTLYQYAYGNPVSWFDQTGAIPVNYYGKPNTEIKGKCSAGAAPLGCTLLDVSLKCHCTCAGGLWKALPFIGAGQIEVWFSTDCYDTGQIIVEEEKHVNLYQKSIEKADGLALSLKQKTFKTKGKCDGACSKWMEAAKSVLSSKFKHWLIDQTHPTKLCDGTQLY